MPSVNADVLASIIDGTHLPNGTYARSFTRLARESNSAQVQFLDISAGYAAVGLLPAILAIAIFMIDRIRDRQRQLASLRAFGLSSAVVRRSVRIETGIIALTGMLIGIACGVLLAWRVGRTRAFATAANSFGIPLVPLLTAIAVVLVASILAANAAARRASGLQPAHALRVDE